MNINPWLAEKVQEYRNQNKDSVLRADYDFIVQAGSKLSWNQHLTVRALQSALKWDSFLQTIRLKMDLPIVILDALYLCHVDCVADLVQLSEEELQDQGIKQNTIRLSIGTEHIDDIIADLEKGFKAVSSL